MIRNDIAKGMIDKVFYFLKIEWADRDFYERLISWVEILIGLHILIFGKSESLLLGRLVTIIPLWMIGVIWILSGAFTVVGFYLWRDKLLRFLGALGSIFVWLFAGLALAPSPFMYIYFALALGMIRKIKIIWVVGP